MTSTQRSKQFKIFITEDSPIVVERLKIMLNDLKYFQVAGHASSISTALQLIAEIKPDIVLIDIHLKEDAPNASGIDLLAMLRKAYPDMFIMMLTNLATPEYIDKCKKTGADYFFDKTNDFDKIPQTLNKIFLSS